MKIPGYRVLILLRFLFTLNLQNGYIHPDEFFQSIEIVAGDILDLEVYRPWEFNTTDQTTSRPIRCITFPYLTVGLPLLALRWASRISGCLFDVSLLTPYMVLVVPRLVAVLLSCTADYHLMMLCRLAKRSASRCLFVYTASYIVLVYLSRTLSNAIELILFAALLHTVGRFLHDSDRAPARRAHLWRKGGRTGDPAPRGDVAAFTADRVAVLVAVGTFNRPTFLAYAAAPLGFWLLRDCRLAASDTQALRRWRNLAASVTWRAARLIPSAIITSAVLIVCDTLYYQGGVASVDSLASLLDLEWILRMDWVVTPWNFVRFNTDLVNLANHGLHSHVTHLLVNVPLLFGVLGVTAIVQYCKAVRLACSRRRTQAPPLLASPVDVLATCSLLVPLVLLSLVPHQEPRFLLPLLVPLALLHGERLTASHSKLSQALKVIWIFGNLLGWAFYGLLHQGGVVPGLSFLHGRHVAGALATTDTQAVFYHTYMPPRFLLLRPNGADVLPVHDLMGGPVTVLTAEVANLLSGGSDVSVVLFSPASLRELVRGALSEHRMFLNKTFPLHLSMEDPPAWGWGIGFISGLGLDMHTVYPVA